MRNKETKGGLSRNYQFVQFLLDFFAVAQLAVITICIADTFNMAKQINRTIVADGGDTVKMRPAWIIIWGVLSLIVFAAAIVLTNVYRKRTKLNQSQYNMWVYAVYIIRTLILLILFYAADMHLKVMLHQLKTFRDYIDLGILMSLILIVIIVRFTQIRIEAAGKKESQPQTKKEIVED